MSSGIWQPFCFSLSVLKHKLGPPTIVLPGHQQPTSWLSDSSPRSGFIHAKIAPSHCIENFSQKGQFQALPDMVFMLFV